MNIVCATDDNFIQHCCIMLTSLLVNNKDVHIFVLTEGLTKKNEDIIIKEVENHCGIVEFCLVNPNIIEKFPMPQLSGLGHISRATYYRLMIPEILPQNIDKVIYLDCDIIINASLEELWNSDLTGFALAAVPQIGSGFEAERLGYPIEYGYFNAGVNLINMKYWRENNIPQALIDYIYANYNKIKYHDQDALNAVLYDKCIHLLPQWNMTSIAYSFKLSCRGDKINSKIINDYSCEKINVKQFKNNPIILHYVSRPKPWQKWCVHPMYDLYYKYAKYTINYAKIKKQPYIFRFPFIAKNRFFEFLSFIKQTIHRTDKSRL